MFNIKFNNYYVPVNQQFTCADKPNAVLQHSFGTRIGRIFQLHIFDFLISQSHAEKYTHCTSKE